MKRNFVISLFGSFIGFGMLLIVLSATGIVGARDTDASRDDARPNVVSAATPLTSTFTYNGQLKNNGAVVNGSCQMAFRLYDDPSTGNLIGSPITPTVPVTNGLFTVGLNFGNNAFDGKGRWLDMRVSCGGPFTQLPRQTVTAAPYSLFSLSTGALQSYPVTTTAPSSGQVLKWNGSYWSPGIDNAGGGGWSLTGNAGTNPTANFLGTTNNVSLTLRVSNTAAFRIVPNALSPNIIGGFSGNFISSTVVGSVIGGGGWTGSPNYIQSDFATISGGSRNLASKVYATVGGGAYNTASGIGAFVGGGGYDGLTISGNQAIGNGSTIGGGVSNTANGLDATVAGGNYNTAGDGSVAYGQTVGGGENNIANNQYTTIPGGYAAQASNYGQLAYANGAFATAGDAQTSVYVLRNVTNDSVQTELFLDGVNQRIKLASNQTLTFDILITARSSAGLSAGYQVRGVIKNVGGTTALIGAITKTVLGEEDAALDVDVQADNTNDALVVKVTGNILNFHWVATVRTVEVGY
jgi:hypothetical protein